MGQPRATSNGLSHVHNTGDRWPYCDAPIPNEKARAIEDRMAAEDRDRIAKLTERMTQQFLTDKEKAVALARDEARQATENALAERITTSEQARTEAVTNFRALKDQYEQLVDQRVQQVRETLEKDKDAQINATNAKHFEESQKLSTMVADLQRKLEKRTNEELGEGAEIDLFEALKCEFEEDRLERIGRGKPGADIRHIVINNGRECGKIIYDSKNRGTWRNEYVDKLAQDQRAERADHAILASLKFPAETRQLHIEDGVIIANPARVVVVVQMLRRHMAQVSTLQLSNTDREKKATDLYAFIRSKRFEDQLAAIETHSEDLLALQEKEKRAHEHTWKHQQSLIRTMQRVRAALANEIDGILQSE